VLRGTTTRATSTGYSPVTFSIWSLGAARLNSLAAPNKPAATNEFAKTVRRGSLSGSAMRAVYARYAEPRRIDMQIFAADTNDRLYVALLG